MNDTSDSALIDKYLVHIVSLNKLQAELMSQYLEKSGIETTYSFELDGLFSAFRKNSQRKLLGLLDYQSANMSKVYSLLRNNNKYSLAVFNAMPNNGIENDALNHGLKGLFYQNDSLEVFSKGAQTILNGDVWFSRKTLFQHITQTTTQTQSSGGELDVLTLREKEILIMIAAGAGNQEIADKLRISLYTAKNHVYRIYKKINVQTRLEAIKWAVKNIWL